MPIDWFSVCLFGDRHLREGTKQMSSEISTGYVADSQNRPLILVVDDAPECRRYIAWALAAVGATIETAEDGAIAELKVRQSIENGIPHDLIASDVEMPNVDGLKFIASLRNRGIRTPAIALTANSTESDRTAYAEAGFDDVVAKPVSATALVAACNLLLCGSNSAKLLQLADRE